ncbi:MAG TPA: hydrogenase maturation protease [Actinospica sp.]|nr:hydrogenase maturation protease [Actinospica sp.]
MSTVVIGVGNELRGDDGFGGAVLESLRERLRPEDGVVLARCDGEPSRLIELWDGFDHAIVIDVARDGPNRCGHLHHRELIGADGHAAPPPAGAEPAGNGHALGPGTALRLADALGRLPARLTLLAVSGRNFDVGAPLSAPVAAAVPVLVRCVRRELARDHARGDQGPDLTVPTGPARPS